MARHSLALRLFFASLLVIVLPILIYLALIFGNLYEKDISDVSDHLVSVANTRSYLVSDYAKSQLRSIDGLTILLNLKEQPPQSSDPKLNALLEATAKATGYIGLYFFKKTAGGQFICTASSDPTLLGNDYSRIAYVQKASQRGSLSFVYFGGSPNQQSFYSAKTILSPAGEELGLFIVETPLGKILEMLVTTKSIFLESQFSIVNEQQVIFASSDTLLMSRKLVEKPKLLSSKDKEELWLYPYENGRKLVEYELGGDVYIASEAPVDGVEISLFVSAAKKNVVGVQQELIRHLIILTAIVFLAALLLTYWITQRISRPWNQLAGVMAQIGQGDYSTRFEPDPLGFEINELGDNLNRMVSALLQQMESAKEERVKKETLANELTIGRSIQLSILPQEMPQLPSLDIAARALPAKEVGGDFYDIFTKGETGKREVILSIADAAGKGISACLYSLCLRSMLRSYEALSDDVGLIVQQANNLFAKDTEQTSMFVTAFVAVYDEGSGRLNYFSCGHPPTLLLRKDGSIEKLWTEGMAMGVQDFEPIKQASCTLQRGDLLCLYTDGVTEAHNPKNELFGEKRLEEFLIAHRDKPANQVCDDLLAAIENFAEGAAQHDDITMVVMKVL